MIRKLSGLVIAMALVSPAAAFAAPAKHHTPTKMKVGQACSSKKESTYKAHGYTCVKGHLRKA
jgi:hypothetical protein